MFRLTVLLCCGVFLVLLIAGEDKGQQRQGLSMEPVMAQAHAPKAPRVKDAENLPDLTAAVYVPAQPVRVAPVRNAVAASAEIVEAAPEPQPQNRIAVVNARSANVRSGPSTSDPVLGRLASGEQVLLVAEDSGVEGWSLITIEGDGLRGYIATRLLQPLQP